jgi:hypothetical protein
VTVGLGCEDVQVHADVAHDTLVVRKVARNLGVLDSQGLDRLLQGEHDLDHVTEQILPPPSNRRWL